MSDPCTVKIMEIKFLKVRWSRSVYCKYLRFRIK